MKHNVWLFVCFVCFSAVFLSAQGADKVRTWTDVQGRTMQAEFVREVDGDVAFLKDGKLITFPLDRLSEADRKTIRELEANKVVPEEEKPAGATPALVDPVGRTETPRAGDSNAASPPSTSKDSGPANRVWMDARSNKFAAKFVRMHDGNVVLLRGSRTMTIGFYELSVGDQAYVRELLTARGEERQIPAPPVVAEDQNTSPPPSGGPAPQNQGLAAQGPPPGAAAPFSANDRIQERLQEQMERQRAQTEQLRVENEQRLARLGEQNAQRAQQMIERDQARAQAQQEAYRNQIVGNCTGCKKSLTREQGELKQCPHCGAAWQFEIDQFGNKREIAGALPPAPDQNQSGFGLGWTLSERGKVKLFTRIIIPLGILIISALCGAAYRNH
jgi:hypothetical protein